MSTRVSQQHSRSFILPEHYEKRGAVIVCSQSSLLFILIENALDGMGKPLQAIAQRNLIQITFVRVLVNC